MEKQKIQILSNIQEATHSHKNIELLYILIGKVDITINGESFQANSKDIILINSEEIHAWKEHGNALLCRMYVDYYKLKQVIKKEKVVFKCNSITNPEIDYARLRYILETILRKYQEEPDGFWVKSLYYSLLEALKAQYLDKERSLDDYEKINGKVKDVLDYIQNNYQRTLNLSEIAKQYYISESAFSRFFKREIGVGFTEYVRNVRLEHAKEELQFSNQSITEISYDCGFSNISVFNKNFKQVFSITPKEYRKNIKQKETVPQESDMIGLATYLEYSQKKKQQIEKTEQKICLDLQQSRLLKNAAKTSMNVGMFADLLEAKLQKHVATAIENLGLKYIHIANPFDPVLKIRSGHETEQMNFEKVDSVLDFLLEQGVCPVLELSERRRKMIVTIGSDDVLEKTKMEPVFLSLEEWEQVLTALIEHLTEYYTAKEVSKWMFEIWCDPEQVTGIGKIPYKKLYKHTWQIIKRYIPEAKIGGSGLNATMPGNVLREQLCWWKDRYDRPDFLTFMSYPYQVERQEEQVAGKQYSLLSIESDTHFVKQDIDAYHALLDSIEYPATPIWLTEWNTSLSERNIYNDSCAKACHMLMQMVDATEELDQMNYSSISDWTVQYFDSTSPLIGATGLITKDGILKPAYYAMEFWGWMGERLIGKGQHYIATSQHRETIQILAFNAKQFSYSYNMKAENSLEVKELPFIFKNNDKLKLQFELKNMREGKHKICMYRVSESCGNVLAEWGKLGYSKELMRSEISYLKQICIPRMEVRYMQTKKDILEFELVLESNEMAFVQIL